MKTLAPLTALLLCAACPEQVGLQCPPNTTSLGQFALAFAAQHPSGECIATVADGGSTTSTPLTLGNDAGSTGTFCTSTASDGGTTLTLVVPGSGAIATPLVDGGFNFSQTGPPTNGTGCVCNVVVSESFAGILHGEDPDAGFGPQSDGGYPPVVSITGSLLDTITAVTAGDSTCLCTTPCTVTYGVAGSRF